METAPSAPVASSSFIGRNQFLIYRLFSLAGLMPVGGYLCVHLLTNATILDSPAVFQEKVDLIHSLGVVLPIVEWVFIFLPLMFHAAVGWMIIAGAVPNNSAYPYAKNLRYTLQRGTGIIAFFFIMAHVMHMHHYGSVFAWLGGGQFEPEHAASSAGRALQGKLMLQIFYAVGVLSCAYHFANGLWTQGITWGLWTSVPAQRRANWISGFIGVGLSVVGLSALWGMSNVDIDKAVQVEDRMEHMRKAKTGEEELASDAQKALSPGMDKQK